MKKMRPLAILSLFFASGNDLSTAIDEMHHCSARVWAWVGRFGEREPLTEKHFDLTTEQLE